MTTYILGLVISFAAGAWFIYKAPEKKAMDLPLPVRRGSLPHHGTFHAHST